MTDPRRVKDLEALLARVQKRAGEAPIRLAVSGLADLLVAPAGAALRSEVLPEPAQPTRASAAAADDLDSSMELSVESSVVAADDTAALELLEEGDFVDIDDDEVLELEPGSVVATTEMVFGSEPIVDEDEDEEEAPVAERAPSVVGAAQATAAAPSSPTHPAQPTAPPVAAPVAAAPSAPAVVVSAVPAAPVEAAIGSEVDLTEASARAEDGAASDDRMEDSGVIAQAVASPAAREPLLTPPPESGPQDARAAASGRDGEPSLELADDAAAVGAAPVGKVEVLTDEMLGNTIDLEPAAGISELELDNPLAAAAPQAAAAPPEEFDLLEEGSSAGAPELEVVGPATGTAATPGAAEAVTVMRPVPTASVVASVTDDRKPQQRSFLALLDGSLSL